MAERERVGGRGGERRKEEVRGVKECQGYIALGGC